MTRCLLQVLPIVDIVFPICVQRLTTDGGASDESSVTTNDANHCHERRLGTGRRSYPIASLL